MHSDSRRLTGGRILTGPRVVESIVLERGRVVAAGTDAETLRLRPTGAEELRLEGRLVIPGLIDAHLHLADITRAREGLELESARSIDQIVERLADWTSAHPRGVVTGRGWSVEALAEQREPRAADLDRTAQDRPVVLFHASGHAAVVNRTVLDAVGYSSATPDPEGGRIGREADGSPNGLLYETALQPIRRVVAAEPLDLGGLGRTIQAANAFGLTTVATMNTDPEELAALYGLYASAPPTLRVRCYVRAGIRSQYSPADWAGVGGGAWLAVPGIKAMADGAFGPRTAWLSEPYADRPEESGVATLRVPELVEMFSWCAEEGRQPAVHAIGDRALDEVLTALESLGHHAPARPRIEHASLVPPPLAARLRGLQPTLVVQPGFVWSDAWLPERLGPSRVRWAYPFRSLTGLGLPLAGSTDAPYDPSDPWRGMSAAVSRRSPEGGSANDTAAEALSSAESLELFTRHAARALREPDLGSLEPASRADFVILDARDWDDALARGAGAVRETWVGGTRVFERAGSGSATG